MKLLIQKNESELLNPVQLKSESGLNQTERKKRDFIDYLSNFLFDTITCISEEDYAKNIKTLKDNLINYSKNIENFKKSLETLAIDKYWDLNYLENKFIYLEKNNSQNTNMVNLTSIENEVKFLNKIQNYVQLIYFYYLKIFLNINQLHNQ